MTKFFLAYYIFFFLISCNQNNTDKKTIAKLDTFKIEAKNLPVDKITFDFTVPKKAKGKSGIRVYATLFNSYRDTVYFLTWSYDGLVYDFIYDTTKLTLFPNYVCNGSYPTIEKIPPGGRLDFNANFIIKKQDHKIKLGYDFCRVEKNFNTDLNQVVKFEKNRQKTIPGVKEKYFE